MSETPFLVKVQYESIDLPVDAVLRFPIGTVLKRPTGSELEAWQLFAAALERQRERNTNNER